MSSGIERSTHNARSTRKSCTHLAYVTASISRTQQAWDLRDTCPSKTDISVGQPPTTLAQRRPFDLNVIAAEQHSHALPQEATETWMLLEFADRGSLDKAIVTRRFYKRGSVTLDLVRPVPVSCSSRHQPVSPFAGSSDVMIE